MLQWFIRFSEFNEFGEFNESSAPFRKNSFLLCYYPLLKQLIDGITYWGFSTQQVDVFTVRESSQSRWGSYLRTLLPPANELTEGNVGNAFTGGYPGGGWYLTPGWVCPSGVAWGGGRYSSSWDGYVRGVLIPYCGYVQGMSVLHPPIHGTWDTVGYDRQEGNMHPTGMLSCPWIFPSYLQITHSPVKWYTCQGQACGMTSRPPIVLWWGLTRSGSKWAIPQIFTTGRRCTKYELHGKDNNGGSKGGH